MQMLARKDVPARSAFADRVAIVLNANARAVDDKCAARLRQLVPHGDLFLTYSLDEAQAVCRTIARRGYGRVFTGGGDGTVVATVTLLKDICAREGRPMPQLGVLKLGTGNALAAFLGSGKAHLDVAHAVSGGAAACVPVHLIKTDDGRFTPFAGMGYDGEVLNDYLELKEKAKTPLLKWIFQSVWGYLGAMLFRTVPRRFAVKDANVTIRSKHEAYRIMRGDDGRDHEVRIPPGSVIYEGPAPCVAVGTTPYFGYGFTMFPHARRKEGFMQVRIPACGIPTILLNLWPRIWNGSYRHPKIFDFLAKDVIIEGDRALDLQVGGDASGRARSLSFAIDAEPVEMLVLDESRAKSIAPRDRSARVLPLARA